MSGGLGILLLATLIKYYALPFIWLITHHKTTATCRWDGADPVLRPVGKISLSKIGDRCCIDYDMVSLTWTDSLGRILITIVESFTDADCNVIGHIWLDRHKIGAYYTEVVVINRKNERGVYRCIDQTQEIFFPLKIMMSNSKLIERETFTLLKVVLYL